MSFSQTVTFDTSSSFSVSSSTLAAFTGGAAQVSQVTTTGNTFNETFDTSTGFSFTAGDFGFTSGAAVQLIQSISGAISWGNFTHSINLNYGEGTVTSSMTLSAALSSGSIYMVNSDTSFWVNTSPSNFNATNQGTIEVDWTPNYTGNPAGRQYIIGIYHTAQSNDVNKIELYHNTNGQVIYSIYDQSNTSLILNSQIGVYSAVAGTNAIFSLNWDLSAGVTEVYVNGTILGTTATATGTRDTAIGHFKVGSNRTDSQTANFRLNGLVVYNSKIRSGNYTAGTSLTIPSRYGATRLQLPDFSATGLSAFETATATEAGSPRYTIDGKYWDGTGFTASSNTYATANSIGVFSTNIASLGATTTVSVDAYFTDQDTTGTVSDFTLGYETMAYTTTEVTFEPLSGVATDSITSFTATVSTPGTDSVGFITKVGSNLLYHDGTGWTTSAGTLAQSNTKAEVASNISTLSTGATVVFVAVLKSADGSTSPDITSYTMGYDYFRNMTSISTCVIGGYVYEDASTAVNSATVHFLSEAPFYLDGNMLFIDQTVTTDANGYYEATLPQTASKTTGSDKVKVKISYTNSKSNKVQDTFRIIVPASTSADIEDTVTT